MDITVENVFPDGPSSNPTNPSKALIRSYFRQFETAVDAGLSNGGLIYDTKANMDADLAHAANASAWVIADGTVANNGIYRKNGASGSGSWTRLADLPYSFIRASNAGAGTANAIQATTSIPIPAGDGAAEIILNITANNTGAATVSFNGGSALTIKTASGADVQEDYLIAGAVVSGYVVGSIFQLTSEVGTAAAAAAAQAAADAAVAAAGTIAVKYAADDTAVKALTGVNDKAIFNLANEGWWLPTSDDISAEITASDPRFLPTSGDATGASGGFYQAGSLLDGSPWENVAVNGKMARHVRLGKRLLIGDAVKYNGFNAPSGDVGDCWLSSDGAGSVKMDYLLINAGLASVHSAYVDATTEATSNYAILGASRNNGRASGGVIGLAGYVKNDGSGATSAWGAYIEGKKTTTTAGSTLAAEFDSTNTAGVLSGAVHPYQPHGGTVGALHIVAGGDPTVNPVLYDVHFAVNIGNNGAAFKNGLVFQDNGLVRDGGTGTGRGHAILMAANHAIEWYQSGTNSLAASLYSGITANTYAQSLAFQDAGLGWFIGSNVAFRLGFVASAVNYFQITPSATGGLMSMVAQGTDTNVGFIIRPKGSESGHLRGGSNTSKFQWSDTGIAFYGVSPIARQAINGALSTVSDAAAKAVLTNMLSAMTNLGLVTNSTT